MKGCVLHRILLTRTARRALRVCCLALCFLLPVAVQAGRPPQLPSVQRGVEVTFEILETNERIRCFVMSPRSYAGTEFSLTKEMFESIAPQKGETWRTTLRRDWKKRFLEQIAACRSIDSQIASGVDPAMISQGITIYTAKERDIVGATYRIKKAEPGATDNPGDAQRLREDH